MQDNLKLKKLENYRVILPDGGTNINFGVNYINKNNDSYLPELNMQLTRELFGVSYKELNKLIIVLYKMLFPYNEYLSLPRITRSNKKSNSCDLTGYWIPKNFPYIAFEQSSYLFGHISLLGFYTLLSFLIKDGKRSNLFKLLRDNEISDELLIMIREIVCEYADPIYFIKISKTIKSMKPYFR